MWHRSNINTIVRKNSKTLKSKVLSIISLWVKVINAQIFNNLYDKIIAWWQCHSTHKFSYINHNNCNNYTCIPTTIHWLNTDYQVFTARNETKMLTLNMASQTISYYAHTSQVPFLSYSAVLQHHSHTKFYCNHGNLGSDHDNKPSGSTKCREFLGHMKTLAVQGICYTGLQLNWIL